MSAKLKVLVCGTGFAGQGHTEAFRYAGAKVVGMVGRGLSNDEIAEALYLSPLTVKTHVSRAMTKLHARDRAQLVALAFRTGLTTVDDL